LVDENTSKQENVAGKIWGKKVKGFSDCGGRDSISPPSLKGITLPTTNQAIEK